MAQTKIPKDQFLLRLSCPVCDESAVIKASPPKSLYDFECSECDFEAEAFVAVVRSKRSKKSGQGMQGSSLTRFRKFNIRVIDLGKREHHLEYNLVDDTELEMKQGDLVVFFTDEKTGRLAGVCNTTLRVTEEVQAYRQPSRGGCAFLLAIGVLLASAGFAFAALN